MDRLVDLIKVYDNDLEDDVCDTLFIILRNHSIDIKKY